MTELPFEFAFIRRGSYAQKGFFSSTEWDLRFHLPNASFQASTFNHPARKWDSLRQNRAIFSSFLGWSGLLESPVKIALTFVRLPILVNSSLFRLLPLPHHTRLGWHSCLSISKEEILKKEAIPESRPNLPFISILCLSERRIFGEGEREFWRIDAERSAQSGVAPTFYKGSQFLIRRK